MSNPDPLISLPELSRRLRLPRSWLRSEARAGRLPCLHVGRRQYFSLEAIHQCLADRAATSTRRLGSGPTASRSAGETAPVAKAIEGRQVVAEGGAA